MVHKGYLDESEFSCFCPTKISTPAPNVKFKSRNHFHASDKVTEFLDHNDNDKEGDRKSSPVVSRLLEEKEDIKLKIDRARKHASLLNKERLELTQTL